MRTHFELIIDCPRGPIVVDGHGPVVDGFDGGHATTRDGQPMLPSTALRGALRESAEAILRGLGRPACRAGRGLEPGSPCTCEACRLFGGIQTVVAPGASSFSPLVLEDGHAEVTGERSWGARHGVSIGRAERSAREGLLFVRWVPGPRSVPSYRAEGSLESDAPELRQLFEAAVRATKHLGSGRSRGLARVDLALGWQAAASQATSKPKLSGTGDVYVRLTFETPACIGAPMARDNLRKSRSEIPGSALRGAVGFGLAAALPDPDHDAAFQALVAPDGATFDFLHPVDAALGGMALPFPLTARTCKREKRRHGVHDGLLDRVVVAALARDPNAASRAGTVELLEVCPHAEAGQTCGEPLKPARGWRTKIGSPKTRVVTRTALDRASGSALEQALFSTELIEAGETFEGTIRNVPTASRDRLADALGESLTLGRGRARGWGRAFVQVIEPWSLAPMAERARRFAKKAAERLQSAGADAALAARLLPLTLASPLLIAGEGDGTAELGAALDLEVSWFLRVRRFGVERGWDQRATGDASAARGYRDARRSAVAGSVFVAELPKGTLANTPAVLAKLAALERSGAGERRHQGFGRVLVFDPIIFKPFPKEDPMSSNRPAPAPIESRKALVEAAERVMNDAAETTSLTVKKAQLSHLVSVAREATCAEEIENYLRYQAGRQLWKVELANAVIAAGQEAMKGKSDTQKLEAWRYYATYLSRTFTYLDAAQKRRG